MRKILYSLVIVALIFLSANVLAPTIMGEGLYQALHNKMELERNDVTVQANPGIKIFGGHVDAVRVQGTDVRIGKLGLSSFDCQLQNVDFSPLSSIKNGQVVLTGASAGELTAVISGEEIKDYLTKNVDKLSDVTVDLSNDKVHVKGKIALGGVLHAQAKLDGRFAINQTKLQFVPDSMSIEGFGIERLITVHNIDIYDFSDFPLGIRPDTVSLDHDKLIIHGAIKN